VTDDGAVTAARDDDVLCLTLDRPSRRNALSHSMVDALVDRLTAAATDDALRAIHIRGAGTDFCAGADWVSTNNAGLRPRAGDLVRRIPHTANRVIELVHGIHLPVVCSVQGWAVGLGCNLALAADFAVAADDSVFWEPFVGRGFSPDSGSTWLLPRLIGLARAKEMLLLGEKVIGKAAADWGLIHRSVAAADVDGAAQELVTRLATGPTVAIGLAKQALNHGQHATLSQAMTQELFNVELSCRTTDFKEGLAAFHDKRAPEFGGR
jgi:2-(1,2-epoxy-1,2-dihydrophenyl)acetyl-CoA isomerase